MHPRLFLVCLFTTLLACFAPLQAQESRGLSVIRDTEIEQALRAWCAPVWRAAGLNPESVRLVLVQSPEINAFVAGGPNIFVYTGLITATKNPGELLGVIAHETGHIAGGHLAAGREAMQRASYESMLGTLLGIGAAVGGGGDAAHAIMLGSRGMAISGFLAHSRVQEASADQAALTFLENARYNPSGLESFLNTLKGQELLPESQQISYLRTHPLTSDRLDAMAHGVEKSHYADSPWPAPMLDQYARIKAKLQGFIEPRRVSWIYSDKDSSTPALYARAIAAYQQHDKTNALALADQLIGREKNNPWFHEIKGQMLRDFGDLPGAASSYRRAIDLAPEAALIRIDLAQVLIEMPGPGQDARYAEAEKNLDFALPREPKSTSIHRLYATLFGRMGREAEAQYHLAEEATLEGNFSEARKLLAGALPNLPPASKALRQANDLKVYLDSQPKKDDKDRR